VAAAHVSVTARTLQPPGRLKASNADGEKVIDLLKAALYRVG
jgi:hypothetical protein